MYDLLDELNKTLLDVCDKKTNNGKIYDRYAYAYGWMTGIVYTVARHGDEMSFQQIIESSLKELKKVQQES